MFEKTIAQSFPLSGNELLSNNTPTKKPDHKNDSTANNEGKPTISHRAIGQAYEGGIIAYILHPGDPGYDANTIHGLIAAPFDQSKGAAWGCYGLIKPGIYGTVLGTGNQNTIDIINSCSEEGIAARLCGDLVLNGYEDWYLPSKDELNKLYLNRKAIGGFAGPFYYWSSSEKDGYNAWNQRFSDGSQYVNDEINTYHVRAIRAF